MAATTGPTTSKPNEPFYELAQDPGGRGWVWCLWSGNGRMLASSPEPYPAKKHAMQAIRTLEENTRNAKLIVLSSPDDGS